MEGRRSPIDDNYIDLPGNAFVAYGDGCGRGSRICMQERLDPGLLSFIARIWITEADVRMFPPPTFPPSAALQLRFADNDHGATMIRPDAFKLYECGGRYVLPTVVLHCPPETSATVTDLCVEAVVGAHGALRSWLRDSWLTTSLAGRQVVGNVVVAKDAAVPRVVVCDSLPRADPMVGSRGRVTVRWRLSGTDAAGIPVGDTRTVALDFVPLNAVR
jgi:hypothetical protein